MGDMDAVEPGTLQDLDYYEQLDTLEVVLNQAARYASEMSDKEPTLLIEGKGFSDISLQFEKRVQSEISTLNATMTMNSLSKDLDRLYAMYEFQVKELQNQINIQTQRLENLDELIANYGKTGVIYLSTSDSLNMVDEQSSKEYDKLVDERNEVASQISALNNRLETVKSKLERLQINAGEVTEGEAEGTIALRIPGWADGFRLDAPGRPCRTQDGYLCLSGRWRAGDTVHVDFPMPVRVLTGHPMVKETAHQVCYSRGPLVYCAEEKDNGAYLHLLQALPEAEAQVAWETIGGLRLPVLKVPARRRQIGTGGLYRPWSVPDTEDTSLTLVPYFAWGNRGAGEMRVWLFD